MVILGITLTTYSAILYFNLHIIFDHDLDHELNAKANEVVNIIQVYAKVLHPGGETFLQAVHKTIELEKNGLIHESLKGMNAAEIRWLKNVDLFNLRQNYILVKDAGGNTLAQSSDFTPDIAALFLKSFKNKNPQVLHFGNIRVEDRFLRLIHKPFDLGNEGRIMIEIGASFNPAIYTLHSRLLAIFISIPIVLIMTSFVGRFFAGKILKPVLEITRTAQKITHQDLSARVETIQADDEMRYLTNAFNDMISRLEKSFKYIGEFSSHVAHELKTPLAIIQGQTQLLLRANRSEEEYKRVAQVTLSETERMIRVVEDMLMLTRLDYEKEILKFERLSGYEFLKEIEEYGKILGLNKNIDTHLSEPEEAFDINADPVHIRRLFLNLIDNALKYSPSGSSIDISTHKEDDQIKIEIHDQGAGIAQMDLPKIFDRFFHRDIKVDGQTYTTGTGLGLSMASSIAKAHQGSIEVASRLGEGSTFTVILPYLVPVLQPQFH